MAFQEMDARNDHYEMSLYEYGLILLAKKTNTKKDEKRV